MSHSFRTLACFLLLAGACAGDDGGAAGPTAPSNLTATPLGAVAHLTWKPIVAGATYMYMVVATTENGDSESNQATFVAP